MKWQINEFGYYSPNNQDKSYCIFFFLLKYVIQEMDVITAMVKGCLQLSKEH